MVLLPSPFFPTIAFFDPFCNLKEISSKVFFSLYGYLKKTLQNSISKSSGHSKDPLFILDSLFKNSKYILIRVVVMSLKCANKPNNSSNASELDLVALITIDKSPIENPPFIAL